MKTKNLLMFGMLLYAFVFLKHTTSNSNLNLNIERFQNTETLKLSTINQQNECGDATYEDDNGLVTIEAENLDITGLDWNVKTAFANYTGTGYLSWDGNNNFNSPGNGLITTKIRINTPGQYRFRWRSRIGAGSNSTEHNDSWLRFPDASDFYAEKNGNRVYPNGSGQTPNPNGSSSDGWFKIYLSGSTNWTWSTQTSDNDAHQIYVEFDTAGIYTMEISGRSKDHLIDRITLSNNANDALNLNNTETPCVNGNLSINDPEPITSTRTIKLFPNPAQNYITVTNDSAVELKTLTIFDIKGTVVKTFNTSNTPLDISPLSAGIYYAITDKGDTMRFIKTN